jgi:hypothetical protein
VHTADPEQQSRVCPHPSPWLHPAFPKLVQVFATHVTQALAVQMSPDAHGAHDCSMPHPKLTGAHPVTIPALCASAQVIGVQQAPPEQSSPLAHVPHETFGPHPLLTDPHTAAPHDGGVHGAQTFFLHSFAPAQLPHETVPLPQAFSTDPQTEPAPPSASPHSGGVCWHAPLMHSSPAGQPHDLEWPHPSLTVPQRLVPLPSVHASGVQAPASTEEAVTHPLFKHTLPAAQPPQPMATPHWSTAIVPHDPLQGGGA